MQVPVKKIALLGPESSGKTLLCKKLAKHFKTTWVPEFARNHISSLKRNYELEDILYCAQQQLLSEDEKLKEAGRFLFCDTELIIAKVWCQDVFKKVPDWIDKKIRTHTYDLYLLTQPDIPFKPDRVRENPHRRNFFFNWYQRELEKNGFRYEVVSGEGEDRFQCALQHILRTFPDWV